jgi:hypothetical protein
VTEFCPNGHKCEYFKNTLPKGYDGGICCDICGINKLLKEGHLSEGFHHCSFCRYDKCFKCDGELCPVTKLKLD